MANMKKDLNIQSRTFKTLKSKLQEMEEEESDLSDSNESDSSLFQRHFGDLEYVGFGMNST